MLEVCSATLAQELMTRMDALDPRLEESFDVAMLDLYEAEREAGYVASYLLRMLKEHGGVEAARRLVKKHAVSKGFEELRKRDRLDLTVEALIVDNPKFHALFTDAEIQQCQTRLSECHYPC